MGEQANKVVILLLSHSEEITLNYHQHQAVRKAVSEDITHKILRLVLKKSYGFLVRRLY